MHKLIGRRSRALRGGAAAFGLAALLASVAVLTHPVGRASAAVSVGPTATIVHGCDVGDGLGDFVVATLRAGNQPIDPSQPDTVQIGLAVRADNNDSYFDDSGPVLVDFTGQSQVIRLSGPIKGAHVYLRQYGASNAYATIPVPAACKHIAPPEFAQAAPQVTRSGASVNCLTSDAILPVTVWNEGDVDAEYTVLLIGSNGQLAGTDPQGQLVTVKAHDTEVVQVAQAYQSLQTVYRFTVRVLGIDGQPETTGNRPVQCDSQGHRGPQPTKTPILPSQTPSATISNPPSSSHPSSDPSSPSGKPSTSTSHSRPAESSTHHSSTAARPSNSSAPNSVSNAGGNGNGGNAGSGGDPVVINSSSNSGPVLGDADSTRQPGKPSPSKTPAKQTLVEAAVLTGVTSGVGIGGALVLLGFGAAIVGMVAANRASARKR